MPKSILFLFVFHHANFMLIDLIVKGNLKFFHTEITTLFPDMNIHVSHLFLLM